MKPADASKVIVFPLKFPRQKFSLWFTYLSGS